jgi:hypothetical protein
MGQIQTNERGSFVSEVEIRTDLVSEAFASIREHWSRVELASDEAGEYNIANVLNREIRKQPPCHRTKLFLSRLVTEQGLVTKQFFVSNQPTWDVITQMIRINMLFRKN